METIWEGHHVIFKAVVEKKMKTRGPGWPQGKTKPSNTPAVAYDVKEWMWGLEEASDGGPKQNDNINHKGYQQSTHSQWESKVEEGIGGRGPQGFLGTLWEAHFLWKEAVQIGWANEVHNVFTSNKGFSGEWSIRADSKRLPGKGYFAYL